LLLAPLGAGAAELFSLNTGDLREEAADARRAGKRALMLFFEQEGCPGCAHMKRSVFPRDDVRAFYSRHFVSLAIDIHGSVPLRDFAGRDLTEKSFAQGSKIRATPTFVFYDLNGAELVRIVGPTQTAGEFLLLGEFVTSGAYKTRTFAQYKVANALRKGS
jgi:thioredoxin-related protein